MPASKENSKRVNGLKGGALPSVWWAAVIYGLMKHKRQGRDNLLSLPAGAKTLQLLLGVSSRHLTLALKGLPQHSLGPTPTGTHPECTSHSIQCGMLNHKQQKLKSKIPITEWL